ncbi:MAG: RNA polymerase sigma factor [Planctomycetes bacterium]|jgi:RNA polymerase sigma-70 factor (ECF subfamily)|nr:RNA polymerase sigma factor [Planctomycetota bacterium]
MHELLTEARFREIFTDFREAVHRFAWRLTGHAQDAEDLTQETFVTFWRKRDQYRGEGSLLGYLRRIAFRAYLNRRERLSAKRPPVALDVVAEPAAPAETVAESRDLRAFLRRKVEEALRGLADGVRETFLLFRYEGLKIAEVAEITGAPVKTVESRLKRAHEAVAAKLKPYRDQLWTR